MDQADRYMGIRVDSQVFYRLLLHSVKAHQVRGIAASLALFSDVTLSDNLDAAMWKGHTTFSDSTSRINLYRRRVVQIGPYGSFPAGGAVPGSQVRFSGVRVVTYCYQVPRTLNFIILMSSMCL